MLPTPRRDEVLNVLLLAAVYVVAARVGLLFDPVGGFATLVWAPSGIALVALTLHGLQLWPGVLLGAAVANALVGASAPVALGIGLGNTLGAVAGAGLLHHLRFNVELHDTRSAVRFVAVAMSIAAIPATVGTLSLIGGGALEESGAIAVWRAWWTGDAIGNLLVAPLVLVWGTRRAHAVGLARRLEFLAVVAVNLVVAAIIFLRTYESHSRPIAYMVFPALIWAAVRFGARGAVTAVMVVAAVAIHGTVGRRGPFATDELSVGLLGLQAFIGVAAAAFLVLGATIAESRAATQEAQRARDQAEEANRAKADFLAVMSHELRTPLNAIGGFVDLLLMNTQGSLSATQRNSLERIRRNQYHLQALINDLLAFTRIEAGKMELDIRPLNVNDALDNVEPLIQPELRRKQLVFTRESIDPGLTVRADHDKLTQILLNMLSNAAKYTDDGGMVSVGADGDGGRVRIWVRDSGIGIPPDQLEQVFQPFFQVDRGRTRRYQGIGLGLTIARDLARAMAGDIALESRVGKGTLVALHLPADNAASGKSA